jgi:hypothetical protein
LPEETREVLRKVRKEYFEQRKAIAARKPVSSRQNTTDEHFKKLQASLKKHLAGLDQFARAKDAPLSDKIWKQLKEVSGEWHKVEQLLNDALLQAYSSLNPKFTLDTRERKRLRTATAGRRSLYVGQST